MLNNAFKRIRSAWFRLRRSVYDWFYYKSPVFISLNPLSFWGDWLGVRDVFRKPCVRKYKLSVEESLGSDYFFLETSCNNKWFYLCSHRCGYKYKWGTVRFECVPYLCFIWRNRVKYVIGLESPMVDDKLPNAVPYRENDMYWEGLLSFKYDCNRDVYKTYKYNTWLSDYELKTTDENGDNICITHRHTIINALKSKYAQQIITEEMKKLNKGT